MFKRMSNREFVDWLADWALYLKQGGKVGERRLTCEALREACKRIRTDAEFQLDVRVQPDRDW